MDAQEYRQALAALEMSREGARRFLHIGRHNATSYARGDRQVPPTVAMLLSIILKYGLSPADACRLAGLPAENYGDRRRGRVHIGRQRRFVGKP
jgi:hypothetical protein